MIQRVQSSNNTRSEQKNSGGLKLEIHQEILGEKKKEKSWKLLKNPRTKQVGWWYINHHLHLGNLADAFILCDLLYIYLTF